MESSSTMALSMAHVTKRYSGRTVIPCLDLAVHSGEIVALLGPNGAGKSTTIAMALGFVSPEKGQVRVAGVNVAQDRDRARAAVAYIPENVQLYPLLTGVENLEYFAALAELAPTRQQVLSALAQAGVPLEAHARRVAQYSKGMRQKVGIAIAMMRNCSLLLLDEPTSGLDPTATDDFYLRLRKLAASGTGVLLTTHDIAGARDCANRVVLMRSGEIVAEYGESEFQHHDLDEIYRTMVRGHA